MNDIRIVYLYTDWCQPCIEQDIIMQKIGYAFGDKIRIKKINAGDVDRKELRKFQNQSRIIVHAVPMIAIFIGDDFVKKYEGPTPETTIKKYIDKII